MDAFQKGGIVLSFGLLCIFLFTLSVGWLIEHQHNAPGDVFVSRYQAGEKYSRVLGVYPVTNGKEIVFENGKRSIVPVSEDIRFSLKPNEVILMAPDGSLQLRVDYLEQDQLPGQAEDKAEGAQR